MLGLKNDEAIEYARHSAYCGIKDILQQDNLQA
jgi:hypothetical protein